MTSNVAILTNFRTGSTTFTLNKAEEYDLPYKGELFSHERPHGIGRLKDLGAFRESFKINDEILSSYTLSNWNIYEELRKKHPACYKIMPSHFNKQWLDGNPRTVTDYQQLQLVLEQADKVYYLYRRDFRAQIKSWLAVRRDGSFAFTGFETNTPLHWEMIEDAYYKRVEQLHRGSFRAGETYKATIDPNDPVFHEKTTMAMSALVRQLVENYNVMSEMYKRVPGQLVCYEDYFVGDKYNPYNREITWTSEPEIDQYVTNWDIEGLFK